MSVSCDLVGVDSIFRGLEELGKKAGPAQNKALQAGSEIMLTEVQNTTAFKDKSGDLRKYQSISKVRTTKKGKSIWVGDVDGKVKYGWIVEYGSSTQHARPFMRTAYAKVKDRATREMLNVLKQEIGW